MSRARPGFAGSLQGLEIGQGIELTTSTGTRACRTRGLPAPFEDVTRGFANMGVDFASSGGIHVLTVAEGRYGAGYRGLPAIARVDLQQPRRVC